MKKTLAPFSLLVILLASFSNEKLRNVPDTLDLRANARLSINFLKGSMDMHQDGVPYFTTYFGSNTPALVHKEYDLDEDPGRWLYGFFSARQVSGSVEGIAQEKILKDYLISRMIHDDGLVYLPKYSSMCSLSGTESAWMWGNRSDFMGLLCLYMVKDDPSIKIHLERAVNTLYKLAIKGKGGYYLNQDYYKYDTKIDTSIAPIVGQNTGGWITPLVKYYQWTGNKKALELAKGFADFIVKNHGRSLSDLNAASYGVAAGDFVLSKTSSQKEKVLKIANTHGALFTIGGILRMAEVTRNTEHVEWAKKLLDYTIEHLATSFGWMPEHEDDRMLGPSNTQSSEGCSVADLVNCCIYLARNGYPQYWNYVERYTRNYLEEAQLKNTSWMPASLKREDNVHETYDNISQRVKGSYVGWGDPNDFVNPTARAKNSIQNCCGPQCAWATSLVWHNIVTKNEGGIFVNLLLNKRTPWCEVLSYHPYTGRVDVEMYVNSNMHILVPDWVKKSEVKLNVNGKELIPNWEGEYLVLKNQKQGNKITVNYPMRITTLSDTIPGKGMYKTTWKGNTVIGIDPAGKIAPLFQRKSMLSETCPMKQEQVLEQGARAQIPMEEIDW
jgi:hypothetical protein